MSAELIFFGLFLIAFLFLKQSDFLRKKNKKDGALYEEYISDIYRKDGYSVIEHGKEQGVKDGGIDIIAKKEKELLFIQCKDWNIKNKYRIGKKEIQYTRMNVRDYIEKKPLYKSYDWKIVYITSDNILSKSALYIIKEHKDEISSRVLKMLSKY